MPILMDIALVAKQERHKKSKMAIIQLIIILLDIITALHIERQEGGIESKRNWDDPVYFLVPNVVGLTKKEAIKALFNYHVEYTGIGDYVISQSPKPETSLEMGSTVRLMLGEKE